jgi:hypothetical protein
MTLLVAIPLIVSATEILGLTLSFRACAGLLQSKAGDLLFSLLKLRSQTQGRSRAFPPLS